jgi:cysteine-rich repeat protein
MRITATAVVVLAAVLVARSASGAPPVVRALTLLEPSPGRTSTFGASVAAVGTNVVVGAPAPGGVAPAGPGAAYVFDGVTGTLLHRLTAPTPTDNDGFGQAVGALGSNVLVSALRNGPGGASSGAVHLFDGATGDLLRTFVDPAGNQYFGYTVATVGSNVVVGAPSAGLAYLFDGASATLLHTFTVGGGWSIAAVGTDVLIGGTGGAAYLFDGTTFTLKHIFDNPEPGPDDQFGMRVLAVGTDRVLIANPAKNVLTIDDGLKPGGAAYLFDVATGTLLHTFHSEEDDYPDTFGLTLAALGDDLLIAAPRELNAAGVVYRFDASSGALQQEIRPGNPTTFLFGKYFGTAVAVTGDRLAVGAPSERRQSQGSGVVYVFDPCGNGVLAAGEHCDDGNLADGDGCSATCRFECPPSPSSTCFTPPLRGSRLRLTQDRSIFETGNKLMWKWRGTGSTVADFGDPRTSTAYTLCVYDGSGLRMNVAAPAGQTCAGSACWSAVGTSGFVYDDREGTPSGLTNVRLVRSASGITQIAITGRGYDLDLPVAGCICPFAVSGTITVQLRNVESGVCWEARYPTYANSEKKLIGKR